MFKYLLLITSILFVQVGNCNSDLIIYTKSKSSWNSFLIKEIQQLISNFSNEVNFYSVQFEEQKITYDSTRVHEFLTDDTITFIEKIEDISRMGILETKPEFSLNGFGYDIENLTPKLDLSSIPHGIQFDTRVEINGLDVYADSFDINFVVPELENGEEIEAFKIRILNPLIKFQPGVMLPVETKVKLEKDANGNISINLDKMDSQALAKALEDSFHGFDFQFTDLEITDVELEIFGKNYWD